MLARLAIKRSSVLSPLYTSQIRLAHGYPRRGALGDIPPPASEITAHRNEFDHVADPKEFKELDKKAVHPPRVHDTYDFVDTDRNADPHAWFGFGEFNYKHYDYTQEPIFPKTPDLSAGRLASGATVTRTDVWHTDNEPAIKSIARFAPYNFRAVEYAENCLPVESTVPDGHFDFRHNRLPIGHADRRPFMYFMTATAGFAGLSLVRGIVCKMVHCLWPAIDVFAAGVVEVDIRAVRVGQNFTAKWRGKPVFLRRRTPEMIALAKKDDSIIASLRDPQTDVKRCPRPEWLVCIGVCTHLGCIPFPDQGDWNGYFCPCHGSHYDHSGRIRKGPAPYNLEIPTYQFIDDYTVKLG